MVIVETVTPTHWIGIVVLVLVVSSMIGCTYLLVHKRHSLVQEFCIIFFYILWIAFLLSFSKATVPVELQRVMIVDWEEALPLLQTDYEIVQTDGVFLLLREK